MIYLLKAHICLSIFLMVYWGFLRKNTFYQLNRIYFLLAMIVSLALPLLNVSDFVNQHQAISRREVIQYIPDLSFRTDNQMVMPHKIAQTKTLIVPVFLNFRDIFQAILLSGIGVLLCKLIVQIISIFRFLKASKPIIINQITVRNLSKDISPFSFFNYIFININKHSEEDLSEILAHEHTHARQVHSLDVIMAEVFCLVFWINPLAWLLRKFLKQNLEFLTDQTVLNQGFDSRHYQYNLLKISGLSPVVVANNFNFSDLKLRIKMMNCKRSSNLHLVKYFVIIPLGAILILAFNISKAKPFDVKKSVVENVKEMVEAVAFERESAKITISDEIIPISFRAISDTGVKTSEITINEGQIDSSKLFKAGETMSPQEFRSRVGYLSKFSKKTHISMITVLNSESKNPVNDVEISLVGASKISKTNFQGICFLELPVNMSNSWDDKVSEKDKYSFQIKLMKGSISSTFSYNHTRPLRYILYNDSFKEVDYGNPDKTASYPTDRKGNLVITPKTKWFYCKEDIIKELDRTQTLELSKRPLCKINGIIVAQNYNWNEVSVKSILNMDYWSPEDGEKLVSQFGELARNGIYNLNVLEKVVLPKREYKDEEYFISKAPLPKTEMCTPSADFPTNAIYVIDGKVADSGYLHKNVPVEDIDKLEVMEVEIAKQKYGDKGKKGVILISTKKINKLGEK